MNPFRLPEKVEQWCRLNIGNPGQQEKISVGDVVYDCKVQGDLFVETEVEITRFFEHRKRTWRRNDGAGR